MKKIFLFIAPLLFGADVLLAQNNPAVGNDASSNNNSDNHFYCGIRVVPHGSWLENLDDLNNYQDKYKTKTKWGTGVGVGGGYSFSKNIGVAVDVLYSMQGSRYMFRNVEYDQSVNYLNVPIMFVYTTDPAPVLFVGKVGPQLGFLTGAKIDPTFKNSEYNKYVSDNKEQFNDIIIGGVLSGGARCTLSDKLFLDVLLRCGVSFFNAENDTYKYYRAGRGSTHNVTVGIEMGLNYLFE